MHILLPTFFVYLKQKKEEFLLWVLCFVVFYSALSPSAVMPLEEL